MKMHFVGLIMLFTLNVHKAYAIDRWTLEIVTSGIAMKLQKGKKVTDELILDHFDLLSPLDHMNTDDNSHLDYEKKDRNYIIKCWADYLVSIVEDDEQHVIQDYVQQVLSLSPADKVSNRVLERSFELIAEKL